MALPEIEHNHNSVCLLSFHYLYFFINIFLSLFENYYNLNMKNFAQKTIYAIFLQISHWRSNFRMKLKKWYIFNRRSRRRNLAFSRAIYIWHLIKKQRITSRGPIKKRSFDWWEDVIMAGKLSNEEWLENFRMSSSTFEIICTKLKDALAPKEHGLHVFWNKKKALSVRKKVGVCLYYLASCAEYRVVGNQFGIHKSTVCKTVYEVVEKINEVLGPQFLKFPNNELAVENSQMFERRSHIPNIIGAIDGTHIPILPPSEGYRDFINRKGWASFILQGVVDANYKFMDISIKQPGGSHDAAALASSRLYRNIHNVFPQGSVAVGDNNLPFIIIGDPAYPLLPWLLKVYSGANLTPEEESFNVHLNSARVVVEIAFGRLKARWRRVLKRLDVHYSFAPNIIAACCILHNILEIHKEDFNGNWLRAIIDANLIFNEPNPANNNRNEYEGYNMRIFLTEYLRENFPLLTSQHNI